MAWYKTGTISVTNGSATVYGSGTYWVDVGVLNAGDIISILGVLYEILSIQSNTQLTLATNYLGSTASGQSYAIMPIGLLPSALAQQVKTTLASANTALASAVRSDINNQGLTSTQQQNARTNIAALGAADVGQGAVSVSVAGNTNVTLTSTQAAAQYLTLTGTLTGNITVYTTATAKQTTVYNNTTGSYTVTFAATGGSGVVIPQGQRVEVQCDGTNIINPNSAIVGALQVVGALVVGTVTSTGQVSTFKSGASGSYSCVAVGGSGSDSLFGYAGANNDITNGTLSGDTVIGSNKVGANLRLISGNGMIAGTVDSVGDLLYGMANKNSIGISTSCIYVPSIVVGGQAAGVDSMYVRRESSGGNYTLQTTNSGTNSGNIILEPFGGNVLIGTSTSGSVHRIQKSVAEASYIVDCTKDGSWFSWSTQGVSAHGFNAANTAVFFGKNSSTSRSINAGGTINASGADYAEYMTRATTNVAIAKGDVCGIDVNGRLTDRYSDAVGFAVKSTNPSYVGGDVWGNADAIGAIPMNPVYTAPEYKGAPNPGDKAVLALPPQPVQQEGETEDTLAVRMAMWQADCATAQAAFDAKIAAWTPAFAAWQKDNDSYEVAVGLAESVYKAAVVQYEKDIEVFKAKLEAARQLVDRIAFAGQVPVNVTTFKVGDYIVPQATADGKIVGVAVTSPSFDQYRASVGKVIATEPDGRARIIVKVA